MKKHRQNITWTLAERASITITIRHYYGYCHSLDGATLFSKVDSNKLRINVKNKMTFIDAKFDADLINISEVTSRKTKWPRFFGLPCMYRLCTDCTDDDSNETNGIFNCAEIAKNGAF